jgi:hypothetical protein
LEPANSAAVIESSDITPEKRWEVVYKMPIKPASDDVIFELKFNTMLGNAPETELEIDSLWVAQGSANLVGENGTFRLLDLCKDGDDDNTRLFNPYPNAAIKSLNPNPSSGIVTMKYETSEIGYTRIWISDMLGNTALELLNSNVEAGESELSFDSKDLSDGVYFVIMQTPTQLFRKKLYIVKYISNLFPGLSPGTVKNTKILFPVHYNL